LLKKQENRWIAASLSRRSGANADALETADAMVAIWQEFSAALHPIIGGQGNAALYDRSVSLAARKHPWLVSSRAAANGSVDPTALRGAVARQTAGEAAAGATDFLQAFYDVLVSLIGAALCEQLLSSVREGSTYAGHEIRKP
jgi:hypothetical protein